MTVIDLSQRQRPARTPFKIEIFAGSDLAAADWPALADARELAMYAFQSREFLEVWLSTIGSAGRIDPYLVAVKDGDGRPVLYLPLAIETKFNLRLLRFADCGVADYNAPILAADRALSRHEFMALWAELLGSLPRFDVIDLKKIASDVAGAPNPLAYLDCAPFAETGHAIELAGLRDATDMRRSVVRLRRKLARLHEGLGKTGTVRFLANPSGPELASITERLLELKRQRYLRSAVPDFLATPGVERFYREMMRPGRLGVIGHLSALTVAGKVASAHFGFIGRDRLHYILPTYDPAFARYRVGHLLLQHLIDQSIAEGYDTFDLGVGDALYKNTWTTRRLTLLSHERAITAAGRLYLQLRRVRRLVKASGARSWFRTAS